MSRNHSVHEFVFRGLLAGESLSKSSPFLAQTQSGSVADIENALSYELLDSKELDLSLRMAAIYAAISAFERMARRFISTTLQREYGDNWWESQVSQKIRTFAESRRDEESKVKWHGARGEDQLTYTEMGHLLDIIGQNWEVFEPSVRRIEWARSIFDTIERSRNVIMHSGTLDIEDIERLGMNMRDWMKQVGV